MQELRSADVVYHDRNFIRKFCLQNLSKNDINKKQVLFSAFALVFCCLQQKSIAIFGQFKYILYFCNIRGEKSLGQESVFCFIPKNRNLENFNNRGVRTMQRSFCLYITVCTAHAVPCWYIRQRGVFVSQFISVKGFSRAWFSVSLTSLCAFLVSVSQTHYLR